MIISIGNLKFKIISTFLANRLYQIITAIIFIQELHMLNTRNHQCSTKENF